MPIIPSEEQCLSRITSAVTFDAGAIAQWPRVRTWETENGELALVEEHESVRLFYGDRWQTKPQYVTSLIYERYGHPSATLVGRAALNYLTHRFFGE